MARTFHGGPRRARSLSPPPAPAWGAPITSSAGGAEENAAGSEALRKKPPQNYTEKFEPPAEVMLKPIGYVRSPYKERFGTPRQAPITQQIVGGQEAEAEIHLNPGLNLDLAVRGLEGFEYIWVISWMHLNKGWNPLVTPPRGPKVKRGVLATRAPHRPNPMALSAVRLVGVHGRILKVRGIDLLDWTPVLDIKPYVPYCDAFPSARAGWLDEIATEGYEMKGPDRLEYSPPPPHIK
eukprot:tig00020704_g13186.t1